MSKLLKKIAVKSPRLQFLHGYFSRILIGFQNNCFFFRTTHSNCIFILMNFYFRWDNDFFLFSVFSVFFNWKDNTLDFLKTLLFIRMQSTSANMLSANWGGETPLILIKIIFLGERNSEGIFSLYKINTLFLKTKQICEFSTVKGHISVSFPRHISIPSFFSKDDYCLVTIFNHFWWYSFLEWNKFTCNNKNKF